MTEATALTTQRILIGLAACYMSPEQELGERLKAMADAAQTHDVGLQTLLAEMVEAFSRTAIEDLKVDHARLFVGPFSLLASPFGSVHLEEGEQLMGETTFQVKAIYSEAGLEMASDFNNPPDHISAELEFYAFLLSQEQAAAEAGDETLRCSHSDIRRRFFLSHLAKWGPTFAKLVIKHARTPFYASVGKLTGFMLAGELLSPLYAPSTVDAISATHGTPE